MLHARHRVAVVVEVPEHLPENLVAGFTLPLGGVGKVRPGQAPEVNARLGGAEVLGKHRVQFIVKLVEPRRDDSQLRPRLLNPALQPGRLLEALTCYDVALRLDIGSVSTHWNKALTLLQSGDFERGWAEYEWRWRRETSPPRAFARPMWDGSELAGHRVLLWSEQGLGDTIQFIRYAEKVKERGGFVIFECPLPLGSILRACPGIDEYLIEGEALPEFDFHMPLMSGPHLFGTTPVTIPDRMPFLIADPERSTYWHDRIDAEARGRLRIGIAWQGNPHHPLDRFRSATLEDLRPLSRTSGVCLFILQRGPGAEHLDRWKSDLNVAELTRRQGKDSSDWADTAAIMQNLDLIVTVDTAIAHLAGALGRQVWVALAACPDWRWMLQRGDSPWYPTMRLFRQRELRNWRTVFWEMAYEMSWQVNQSGSLTQ